MSLLCERKLLRMQMGKNEEPLVFFNQFNNAFNELKAASEEPIPESRHLNYLRLPDSYNSFIDALVSQSPVICQLPATRQKMMFQNGNSHQVRSKQNTKATGVGTGPTVVTLIIVLTMIMVGRISDQTVIEICVIQTLVKVVKNGGSVIYAVK